MEPLSGLIKDIRQRMVVLFPAPLGPKKPKTSPFCTVKLTSLTASKFPNFFDKFFLHQITFPSNQIDAVVGFFLKRGFDDQSARSTGIVLLNQAKNDGVNVFQLIDSLKGLSEVQLSKVVGEILNLSRQKTSILGFKFINQDETVESRNIRP